MRYIERTPGPFSFHDLVGTSSMKRPTFSLRDVFWLVLVVAMGLGWWMDQDRIRREVMRFQAISVKSAKAKLLVAEVEFAQAKHLRLTSHVIGPNEFRHAEFQLRVAQAELETARARQMYVPSP
jgi:hypothetical protein